MATLQELQTELNSIPAGIERDRSARANQLRQQIANFEANSLDGGSTATPFNTPFNTPSSFTNSSLGLSEKQKLKSNSKFKATRRVNQKSQELLRYPLAEIYKGTDYIQIKVIRYKSIADKSITDKSNTQNRIIGELGSRKITNKEESLATIFLPIPSNIQDQNSVSYQGSSLNNITGAAVEGVQNIMEGAENAFIDTPLETLTEMKKTITGEVKNTFSQAGGLRVITDLITKSLASQAVGVFGGNVTVDQLLARGEGVVFNPNMELLFNGPSLRQFAFSFKMTPRSQLESIEVKKIIRTFKSNMAPQVTKEGNGNLFLKTPNVFELSYKQGNNEHQFLNKFKQCFLENVSVNYTGEGTYATYGDGTPISIIMNLQFKELEPVYDIDYFNDQGEPLDGTVGY